jgi:hypothetical protein
MSIEAPAPSAGGASRFGLPNGAAPKHPDEPGADPARQAGKKEIQALLDTPSLGLTDEQKAIFSAEIPFEQSIPSMRGETGPNGRGGRDASKDYTNNGSMNVGPFNDNIHMLWKFGGLGLPMKDGSTSKGDPAKGPDAPSWDKVDWDAVRAKYGKNVSDAALQEIALSKKKMLETVGVDAYYAGRRGGAGVITVGGPEGKYGSYGYDPSKYYPGKQPRAAFEKDLRDWVVEHKQVAGGLLADPSKLTDGFRYATRSPPHVNDGGFTK